MEGFDQGGVFFSDNLGEFNTGTEGQVNLQEVKRKFKDFIRQFNEDNFNYKYRYILRLRLNIFIEI